MSRKKEDRRRSRYRVGYVLAVTYCVSVFLHLLIYVVRISYIDDFPLDLMSDPRVSVWQVPAIPVALALGGAVVYTLAWWLLALGSLGWASVFVTPPCALLEWSYGLCGGPIAMRRWLVA